MNLALRSRILVAVVAVAVVPVATFALVIAQTGVLDAPSPIGSLLVLAVVLAALVGILVGFLLVGQLARQLGAITEALERVSAGDLTARIDLEGDDELARLAESHNRLAADLERRDRELHAILAAVGAFSLGDGPEALAERAAAAVREAFWMIEARVILAPEVPEASEAPIPGEPRPVRAELLASGERLGSLVGRLPATRRWEPGDQDLLELFASELATALRNAELFGRVEAQNERLRELDAAKDDFLRGVSHNLQTPLARIRAYADQLAAGGTGSGSAPGDRRPAIIAEQSERLSRMVRQLLTVTRLESGALHPTAEVLALAPRVRRAWEALGAEGVAFELDDRSDGWLAVADPDQLDQVLWALLDNAVKHGGGAPVRASIAVEAAQTRILLTIADRGPGVPEADREGLFARFRRGASAAVDGSGLGLYVSRQLCRAMGGELVLDPADGSGGASLTVSLPGEPGSE